MSAVLEFHRVSKIYGTDHNGVSALTEVTLNVAAGEFLAIRGPSGCGKSTLLHLAGALEMPTSGIVTVGGQDTGTMTAEQRARLRRRDIGYVFQRLNLVPGLTALENVMLALELDGVSARKARVRALDALHTVGLSESLDRYPDDFSGGQQQRIAIARAIVGQRRILLADEPTGALDTISGEHVMDILRSLPRLRGTAVVLVTHEPRYAALADRVLSLRDGEVVGLSGAPASVVGQASQ